MVHLNITIVYEIHMVAKGFIPWEDVISEGALKYLLLS